jgi:glycosyltransferase involved in cell wall biosynthesis
VLDVVVPVSARHGLAARRALRGAMAQADLVHAHGLTAGWLAASIRPRPPLVVSVHNLVLDEVAGRAAPVLRRLEGLLPAVVDRTVALSPEVARRFAGGRGAGRVRVIAPAAEPAAPTRDPATVRSELGVGPGQQLLVAGASRLSAQKDLPTLLRAMCSLPDARLVVFGEGPEESALRALAADLGVEDRVELAGQRASLVDELAAADAVAFSSRWESGPLMLLEALELGRAVVTTPVGFAADLVDDGITGLLVPVGNPDAMARALQRILGDPALAARLGAAGQARVRERHGPEAMARATEAVYREVLA